MCLRDLISITGLDSRAVRKMIEVERRNGSPILSDNVTGYFLPDSPEEKARCVDSLRRRAQEIKRTADALERAPIEQKG